MAHLGLGLMRVYVPSRSRKRNSLEDALPPSAHILKPEEDPEMVNEGTKK